MRALGSWLVSLAAAGMVGAVVTAVTPEKSRQTMRFACGLLIVLLAVQPLRSLEGFSLTEVLAAYESELADRLETADAAANAEAEAIVVREAQTFCEEALAALGIDAEVSLELADADDARVFSYAAVSYRGEYTDEQYRTAAELITAQTGIPAEHQTHR